MRRAVYLTVSVAGGLAIAGAGMSAPAKKAAASASVPPVATYWMDVTTASGMAAGMGAGMSGGQPDMGSIMAMMSGRGPGHAHLLDLRLASRTAAPAAPQAEHVIPAALRMGPSLPLVTPEPVKPVKESHSPPAAMGEIKGRMLIYWGCGDRVGANQPLVFDMAQMAAGKVPENIRRMGAMMGRTYGQSKAGPTSAPGFGEWPNKRDRRPVPVQGSLIGAHQVRGNYSPTIDFTLGQGQDFMAPMNMVEGGTLPSGAALVRWGAVPTATGYALAMFGANEAGDTIMWSSASEAGMVNLDFLSPAEVARQIKAGHVLAPNVTQCAIPAEVARAVPAGMVMGVGYGPEVHFAEAPKNPKWAVTVRYKASGSLMRGMGAMMGAAGEDGLRQAEQQPKRKKRGFGLGDLVNSVVNR